MIAFVVAVATALIGAGVGAVLADRLPRSRPLIMIDGIELSSEFLSITAPAVKDKQLVRRIEDHPGTGSNQDYDLSVESGYAGFLADAAKAVAVIPDPTDDVATLRQLVIEENFEDFESEFARSIGNVWMYLENGCVRHEVNFVGLPPDYSSKTAQREIQVDEDGDYFIALAGPRNLGFIWTFTKGPQREHVHQVAERMANAVAYRNKAELVAILDSLKKYVAKIQDESKALLDDVHAASEPYQRLTASFVLANSGSLPYSVIFKARLVISLKGQALVAGPGAVDSDPAIEMAIVSSDEQDGPIRLVTPGSALRMQCVSDERIDDLRNSDEIRHAYQGSAQMVHLMLAGFLPRKKELTVLRSNEVAFRSYTEVGFPNTK